MPEPSELATIAGASSCMRDTTMTPMRMPVKPAPTSAEVRANTATRMAPIASIHVSFPARRRRTARPDQMSAAVARAKTTAGPGVTIMGVPPARMCAKNPRKLMTAHTTPTSSTQVIASGFI